MVKRPPFLVGIDEFLSKPIPLPDHVFRIGEDTEVHIGQFPNLRAMAFYVIGRGSIPLPGGEVDLTGTGPFALGTLIGDAYLKMARPWVHTPDEWRSAGAIDIVENVLLPLSPRACQTRAAFLYRLGEFIDLALHQPERLPAIIANIDALTNARLTERAAAILRTGVDPGAADLWQSASPLDL